MHLSTLISAAALSQVTLAGYVLQDDYMSGGFYDNFDFFTAPDPTHGTQQTSQPESFECANIFKASFSMLTSLRLNR
jgi:hypothetical protein